MKKTLKTTLAAALSAITVLTFSGCVNDNTMDKIILPDYDAKINEYEISVSGWLIPASLNAENVKWIREAGISVMHAVAAGDDYTLSFPKYDDAAKSALKLLGDEGIGVYVNTCSKEGSSFRKISQFKESPAVLGMSLDEPNKAEIDSMAKEVANYNANADGRTFYSNLFPSFSSVVRSEFGGVFEDYLSYYCDNVLSKLTTGEKWLSVDRYPLTYNKNGEKCLDSEWLFDVQTVAKTARAYDGIKTNFFIQTMPYGINEDGSPQGAKYGSRDRVPTYEDVKMQEYALMAFGYDGISMFCYGTPLVGFEFAESQYAMIGRDGKKTDIYDSVKRANYECMAFDHVLLQFDWVGTFTNDAGQTTVGTNRTTNASFKQLTRISLENIPSLKEVTSTADTLFGYFTDKEGNDGIMAVNYNETTKNLSDKAELTFDATKYNRAVVYNGGMKTVRELSVGKLVLELGVGDGAFVIPFAE